MAEQTSRLAIVLDSTGAQRNAEGLSGALNRMSQSGQKAADGASKVEKATEDEAKALSNLLDKIDPVNAALNRLDEQQQQLAKFQSKGFIDTDTFDTYSKRLEETRNKLTGFNDGMDKGTVSAGQYKNAIRQLPAQFTDIFTSLAGGMPLWLVFTQQGGQIADSFGGFGSLLEIIKTELLGMKSATDESSESLSENANGLSENVENGKKLLGILTPARLAMGATAASLAVLGLAYYKGSQEQDEFAKSLALTGNIAGKTTGQLADMARQVSASSGSTISDAANVVNQLVAAGKVSVSSIQSSAEAILNLNDATGIATEQLVSDFNSLAQDPLTAISKLNDQYHFLTLSTYEQIKALQQEGNQQEAARVASDAYANSLNQKSGDIQESLGVLEKSWKSLTDAAKGAWDAMLDVGRESSPESKLQELNDSIADAQRRQEEGGVVNRFVANASGYNLPEMIKARDELQSQIETQGVLTSAISTYQIAQDKAIKTQQEADKSGLQYMTNADRRAKAIKKEQQFMQAGAITADEYAKRVERINDLYKDPKQPKERKQAAYTEDSATRLLDQINQQTASLSSQLVTTDKLSSVTQQRIKFEQQIADIKTKSQLTADQKSLLARSDEIVQAYKAQEAIQSQVTTLDDYRKMQEQVKQKDVQTNDLLIERLKLLDKAKAAGATDTDATRADVLRSNQNTLPSSVTSVTGGLTPKNGELSGSWGGLVQQSQQLEQAQQALDQWQQQQLQSYQSYYQNRADLTNEYEQQIANVRQQYAQQSQSLSAQQYLIQTTAIQSTMDSLVSITRDGFGEQSAIYKVAFAANKAYAIAQSLVSIQQGIAMAAANPFPANLVAMASVAAASASIVSNIASVSANGFEKGGYTGGMGTKSVAGVVHGQEYVFDAAATRRIGVSNLEAIRNGNLDATLSKPGFGTGNNSVSASSGNSQTNHISQVINMPQNSGMTQQEMDSVLKRNNKQLVTELSNQTLEGKGQFGKSLRAAQGRGNRMT